MALTLVDELEMVFGPDCFTLALFYQYSPALRFELAGGETRVAQFLQALDRARAILGHAFASSEELVVVITVYSDQSPHKLWKRVAGSLAKIGIRQATLPEFRCIRPDETTQTQFAFTVSKSRLPELLWGALAPELGIAPALLGRLTLADPKLGILACPYDDRGLDIIGPNAALLRELYALFAVWLLDFDRSRMDSMFALPQSAG